MAPSASVIFISGSLMFRIVFTLPKWQFDDEPKGKLTSYIIKKKKKMKLRERSTTPVNQCRGPLSLCSHPGVKKSKFKTKKARLIT